MDSYRTDPGVCDSIEHTFTHRCRHIGSVQTHKGVGVSATSKLSEISHISTLLTSWPLHFGHGGIVMLHPACNVPAPLSPIELDSRREGPSGEYLAQV